MTQQKKHKYEKEINEFIAKFDGLDAGQRAVLRRGAGRTLSDASASARMIFYRILPRNIKQHDEEVFYTVAVLSTISNNIHATDDPTHSFGKTMQALVNTASQERRIQTILDERGDWDSGGMQHRLAQMLRLSRSAPCSVNWSILIKDLLSWRHSTRWVQNKWARDFYREQQLTDSEENGTSVEIEMKEDV